MLYRAGPTVLVVRLMGNFQELQSTAINDSLGRVASRLTSQINWKCAKIHKEKNKMNAKCYAFTMFCCCKWSPRRPTKISFCFRSSMWYSGARSLRGENKTHAASAHNVLAKIRLLELHLAPGVQHKLPQIRCMLPSGTSTCMRRC